MDVIVGRPGNGRGVTGLDDADATLLPSAFVATTLKVYVVPFVSPAKTTGPSLAAPMLMLKLPGVELTVYEVIFDPPSSTGGVKVTVAPLSVPVATTFVGVIGGPGGAAIISTYPPEPPPPPGVITRLLTLGSMNDWPAPPPPPEPSTQLPE
jgi:hypothetical protein